MKPLPLTVAVVVLGGLCLEGTRAADSPAATADPDYVPCKVHQTIAPIFPGQLLDEGVIRGEAQLMIEVDTNGQISDSLVTCYTHRQFAEAAIRAAKYWRFEPGVIEHRPVVSTLNLVFKFENSGVTVLERHSLPSRPDLPPGEIYEYRAHGAETLDHTPAAISRPRPIYPKEWIEAGRVGNITINFFIDETGRVRLPVVIAQSDVYLAAAVVASVREWRFEPPTSHGHPVLAHAEQTFIFDPKVTDSNES